MNVFFFVERFIEQLDKIKKIFAAFPQKPDPAI